MDMHFSGGHIMTREEREAHLEWLRLGQKILKKYGRVAYIMYEIGDGLLLLTAYLLTIVAAIIIGLVICSPFILLMYILGVKF